MGTAMAFPAYLHADSTTIFSPSDTQSAGAATDEINDIGIAGGDSANGLSWEACVTEALEKNPDLKEAKLRLSAATARRNAAFGGFLPTLNGSVGAQDSDVTRPWFRDIDTKTYNAGLSASLSLFSGWATVADVRRSMASARNARASLRATEATLRSSLRRAFVDVLYGQVNVRVQDSIANRRKSNAELVRLKYEAGREDKGSAMRADADAAETAFELARAKRALILAQQKLALALGRDEFSPVTVTGAWKGTPPPEAPDLGQLADATPAYAQAEANADSASASYLSAYSSFLPNAGVSAGASRGGDLWKWPPDRATEGWNAGGSISYNFFNGFRDVYGLVAARAAAKEAKITLAQARRDTMVSLQEAYFGYIDAHESVSVQKQYLLAARTRAEIGRAQYANGLLGFVQWDLIEGELVSTERSFIATRRDALNAEATWLKSIGTELKP
jgi:outer membrane protein TolC